MKRTHTKLLIALLAALLLAAGCGSSDDADETPAVEYKVMGGRLVWCSGGAEDMIVPGNASSIGNNAFSNCGTIGTLTIPASVTHIMRYTFSNVKIGKIFFGGTVGEWAAMAEQDGFGETLRTTPVICSDGEWRWTAPAVPDVPVTPNDWQITDGVLVRYSGSAADVTIPDGVTAIGDGAFAGCTGITHVTIPNGVTEIRADAFKDCASLAGVTIPDSVTTIGENAFAGCAGLTNIDIPANVTDIGTGAIPAETIVTYHGTAERWDELAADGGLDDITVFITDENGTLTGYRGNAADITLPDGVKGIAGGAFAGHEGLKHIAIPADVTGIASGSFAGSEITEIEYKGDLTAWGALVEAGGIADELAGITVTCADGTWTPAHTHTWGEAYTNGGVDGHYRTCTGCDERSATEAHTYGGAPQADGDNGHCQTCTGCGAHSPTVAHEYVYTGSDADTHTMTCPTCNHTKSEPHDYGGEAYTDAGHTKTCAGCGHAETTPHVWSDTYTKGGTGGHYRTCTTAGCNAHSPAEAHTYGAYTDDNDGSNHSKTCSVCDRIVHGSHQYGACTDDGNGNHHQTCSDCNHTKTEPHAYGGETYTDAGHTKTCTGCGHSETAQHTWGDIYTNGGMGGHYKTCTTAGCGAHSPAETHQYGTTYTNDKNGKHYQTCPVCSGQSEAVAHTYGDYTDDENGNHYQTCTAAGCNAKSASEAHDCEYKDNGDDTHTTTCTKCTYSDTEEHHYKDGACEVCKCPQPTTVYVASTGSDDNSGSRTKPFATIQKAVDAIIARNDGTSEYTICIDGTLTQSTAGANGMADFSALGKNLNLTIKSFSGTATLDANTLSRVIYAKPASGKLNLTLENLVITGGNTTGDGGGICYQSTGGILTVKGCTISGNTAGAKGGGIYIDGGTVKMKDCTITDCKAGGTSNDEGGGGIYNASGTLELTGVTITLR